MPTYIQNSCGEPVALGYKYNELKEILKPTKSYEEEIVKYLDMAISEGYDNIEDFYNGLGCSNSWKKENKNMMLSHMIKNKLITTFHHRGDDIFYYILK